MLLERGRERELLAACRRQLEIWRFVPDLQHEKSLPACEKVPAVARRASHAIAGRHRLAEHVPHRETPASGECSVRLSDRDDVFRNPNHDEWSGNSDDMRLA